MPPRKRQRNTPSPSPVPEPSPQVSDAPSASPSANFSHNSSHDDATEPPRFFNTTFTTYRASPLYIGKQQALTPTRLELLSRRLRDLLVGDVVRGVQVGLESDAALGRTGALYAVEWRWIDGERILGRDAGEGDGRERSVELGNDGGDHNDSVDAGRRKRRRGGRRVLCIELRYENARFCALLLPDLARGDDDNSSDSIQQQSTWTWETNSNGGNEKKDQSTFLHLPLLLFRMPAPLKSVVIDFLSSTFDCRISSLALGTRTLVHTWETWLSDDGSINGRRALSRDVLFTLGFHIEPPEPVLIRDSEKKVGGDSNEDKGQKPESLQQGLKTIDITIPAADVHRFLQAGENLDQTNTANSRKRKADTSTTLSTEQKNRRRRKLAGGRDDEGWAWRHDNQPEQEEADKTIVIIIDQPFTEALAAYLQHHLGLDMFHPGVRVQRIACDGFALSEGRLKVFQGARGRGSYEEEEEESAVWKLMRGLVRQARGRVSWGVGATTTKGVMV
ncbi:hypothetical protein M426DRAFT_321389 [Hypoxylon sp. CI-4A]|nr:hypothetical protein M426DRAFT_321389 [Hypoxylon sp. CI-4A]